MCQQIQWPEHTDLALNVPVVTPRVVSADVEFEKGIESQVFVILHKEARATIIL